MAPFNDAWPSSIFMSLDAVAIDSVGFDSLTSEWPNLVDIANADNLSIGTMEQTRSTRAISEKRTGLSFSRWADGGRGETKISRKAFFLCLTAASMLGTRAS